MKTSFLAALLPLFVVNIDAQGANPPQDTSYAITQNDANSRIWERTTYEQLPSGQFIPHIHRYQETATGLNFKNPDTGQWEESSEVIEQISGGAVARHGQHTVIFASDLATVGAIDMETPDGQRLQSHLLGLSYFDQASGQSVFIAEVTNCIGQIVGTNQVWYDNAFSGLKAGVRFTYTREGFEQDIILEESPPTPEMYGLNSSTTVLQAFTEFISPPTPVISTNLVAVGDGEQLADQTLSFRTMKIGRGRAFLMGDDSEGIPVCKEWVTLDGRQFLVEEVPVMAVAEQLQSLPLARNTSQRFSNTVVNVVSPKRLLPAQPLAKTGTNQMKVASFSAIKSGFVLDYMSLNSSQTNYIFRGDTTYYISGNVDLYGANTTFEDGTVIKYASGFSLTINTPVIWPGEAYRPVVMLAKDDDTIGEPISGSTGNPGNSYYATKAFYFDGTTAGTSLNIQNLRILNAKTAVTINGANGHVLGDLQVVKCANGIAATNTDFSLRNALFANVLTNFTGSVATGSVEHLTSDAAFWLNKDIGSNLFLTNCLLSAVTNLGSCTTQSVATVASGSGVFQTVGGASYYLTNDSPYRNAGTTNINPDLLARLGRKTTYPPVVCQSSNFTLVTTLGPQIQRDIDIPDLGFHYDPLDYVFSDVEVDTNLTISPGTAVGWFKPASSSYAVHLADKQILTFNGQVEAPDYFVRTSTAQEGNGNWVGNGAIGIVGTADQNLEDVTLSPELRLNFTTVASLIYELQFRDDGGYLIVRANNSRITGGNTVGYVISYYLTNCLVDNQQIGQVEGHTGNEVILRNCTLHNGNFYSARTRAIPISARNCSFDQVSLSVADSYSSNPTYTDYDYNAYTNATDPFPIGGSHDQTSVSFDWQSGHFGFYYLPWYSVLIDAGSTTADQVGLYHFTTQTAANSPETNSIVDIGYHYVAIDDNGNPMDTDGDGTPDYLEDANGNGVVDNGETDWQSATDLGLKVIITRPKNNSVIP